MAYVIYTPPFIALATAVAIRVRSAMPGLSAAGTRNRAEAA